MPGPVLKDGLGMTLAPNSGLFTLVIEKMLTPPGYEDRGAIDTTTLRNETMVTEWAKQLTKMTKLSFKGAYGGADAFAIEIDNDWLVNQQWVLTFPNGGTLTFWGQLNGATPDEVSEGNQPLISMSVLCTNEDNSGVETDPIWLPS